MSFSERRSYLIQMRKRYRTATREQKGALLDEMQTVTGLHRKYLIRLLRTPLRKQRRPRARQRGAVYDGEVRAAVALIAQALDFPTAERLQPQLSRTATLLASQGALPLTSTLEEKLAHISVSTLRRLLAHISRDLPRPAARSSPTTPTLRQAIPTRRIPRDEAQPGHFELDLVHHCGPTAAGEYVCTLHMVDVATGWSECYAILGRSYRVVQDALCHILARLPFPVREIHSDNDSAFLNHHLLRFWRAVAPQVFLSRSRPYHKNDNRFVEQRNGFLVRTYLGYDRLDTVAQTLCLNRIYEQLWLYHNLYLPVRRLQAEAGISAPRRYDLAQTPLQRLQASGVADPQRLEALQQCYLRLNPLHLREEIYAHIVHLFNLPNSTAPQDVFQTLGVPSTLPEELLRPVTLSLERQPHPGNVIF